MSIAMEKKPFHHLPDGTFRNPEGSPKRDPNVKWSYKIFNKENCKIDISEFWNNREQTVFACSKRCANHAKDNWLKRV